MVAVSKRSQTNQKGSCVLESWLGNDAVIQLSSVLNLHIAEKFGQ